MAKPVTIPNTFATATTSIPLANLDADFSTVATALNDASTYSNYALDSGTVDAYVVTLSGLSTTYQAGLAIQFQATTANTGPCTLNVNGQGAKNIIYPDGSTLSANAIVVGAIASLMYDGTSFQLLSVKNAAGGGGGGGSVASVAMSVPAFLQVSGSPITTTGTLAVTYSGTPLPIANGGTGATTAAGIRTTIGAGDVNGPASSTNAQIALFNGTTGKTIQVATTTGMVKATSGVIAAATAGTDYVAPGGALGTPSSGTLTNCTDLPISTGVSGLGTGVATALAVNVGSAGAFVPTSGSGASGTWTISISGSANAATTATNLASGAANQIAYQTGSGATSFITAPTTSSTYLSWNGTTFAWAAASGGGGTTTNALTMNDSGSGAASGTTFDGSVARTISYNTVGAPSTTGTGATGTWSIDITGSAGYAAAISGGGTNRIVYQTGSSTTSFVTAPVTSGTYLKWNGSAFAWDAPAGSGDVSGPASATDSQIALFDSTTGKLIKAATTTGLLKATSGVIAAATAGTDYQSPITLTTTGTSGAATLVGSTLNIPQYSGGGGTTTNAATFNNSGSGDASGTTFDGSVARTISYNTVGAPSTTGTNASGSWGISVTGTAANVAGGAANKLLYQSGSSTTAFADAPVSSGTYLKWNGTTFAWDTPSGSGDVVGPSSAVDGQIVLFDSTTGKLIKAGTTSGILKASSGVVSAATSGTDYAPATTGTSAQLLANNGTGGFSNVTVGSNLTLSAGTLTAGLVWQSVQTTGFTAVAGRAYPCNTTSAAFTVTLPASPSAGDQVTITDYAGTFSTNNLTISPNGNKIVGLTSNVVLKNNESSVQLVYIDSTRGWIAYSGFGVTQLSTIYVFTSTGAWTCPIGVSTIDYLVVGGGGGGGVSDGVGGAGGAGGFRTGSSVSVSAGTTYTITVGAGAAAKSGVGAGNSGSASSIVGGSSSPFSSPGIVSAGGGAGSGGSGAGQAGGSGGSGGGGGYASGAGGAGNTPSTSPSQGSSGGTGAPQSGAIGSGGGGGANAVGGNGSVTAGGVGGAGTASSISGSSVTYAGGGGGSALRTGSNYTGGAGGAGGGGAGASDTVSGGSPYISAVAGTVNTGGGGGGGGNQNSGSQGNGAAGGSGIVIIKVNL